MKRIFIFSFAVLLCGCVPAGRPFEDPGDIDPPIVTDPSGEEADPSTFVDYARVGLTSRVTGVQPMTGIVLWTDNNKNRTDNIQLEFSYMLYNDVCKKKDEYDWSPVENLLKAVASRGHQAVIRFRYVYPGYSAAVPDYIKSWEGYEATNGKSEGKKTEFPDWRCAELQRFHLEFHRRFAEKYDNDPRLAFLETGFGLWAEYHIYSGPFTLGKTFPSKAFQAEFFRKMEGWFLDTPWCISIDAADDTYGPFQQDPSLLEGRFGNFDDSFMCEDHDGYNYESWSFFGKTRYTRAPLGGEFSYYEDYDQEHCLDAKGIYGRTFEGEVKKFHMTFIIGNDQPEYQSMSRIKEASMVMGYHFVVKDFRIKPGEGAGVLVENTGVAPVYRDAYVAVDGVRSSYNLRYLMPGKQAWMAIENPSVTVSSSLSIECDHLVPGQRIDYDADVTAEE